MCSSIKEVMLRSNVIDGVKTQFGIRDCLKTLQRLYEGVTAVMSQCYLDRLPPLPDGKYQPGRAISPSARWL